MKNLLKTALIVLINNALIMSSSATSLTALKKKNDTVYYTGLNPTLNTDTTTTPVIIAPATYPY